MKWQLDAGAYAHLRRLLSARLGPATRLDQRNRFFDTPDRRLQSGLANIRVRNENGRVLLTCKRLLTAACDGLHRYDECEQRLNPLVWRALLAGADPRSCLPLPAAIVRLVGEAPLHMIGGFGNLRLLHHDGPDELCLDRTDLPGDRRDYELELETGRPAASVPVWRERLASWAIVCQPQAHTKFQRFLACQAQQVGPSRPAFEAARG